MKCRQCKTYKKADNCQQCFNKLHSDYWRFIHELLDTANITHISILKKIINKLKNKKEEIRNFSISNKEKICQ